MAVLNRLGLKINSLGSDQLDIYKRVAREFSLAYQNRISLAGGVLPSVTNLQNLTYDLLKAQGSKDISRVLVGTDPHITGYKIGATATQANTVFSLNQSTDLTQLTSAAQPLLLTYSGERYLTNNGVAGNYLSIANLNINPTTSLKISFKVFYKSQGGSLYPVISNITSYSAGTAQTGNVALLYVSGYMQLYYTDSGGIQRLLNILPASNNTMYEGFVNINTITGAVNVTINGTNYTYTSTANGMPARNIATAIAGRLAGSTALNANVYYVKLDIDGSPRLNCDFSTYSQLVPNTFTDSQSNVININRSVTGYQCQVVTKNSIMTDGVDDVLSASYALPVNRTDYYYKVTDSQITTSVQQLGKVDSTFKQHYGGCLFSFAGIHDLATQTKVKTVLQNYTGFFFDVAGGSFILLDDTILNDNTILY